VPLLTLSAEAERSRNSLVKASTSHEAVALLDRVRFRLLRWPDTLT
jgi:hypothetical protein